MQEQMPPSYVLIAPAQTPCSLNMGKSWAARSPASTNVFREADEILGDTLGVRPSDLVFKWCSEESSLKELNSRTDLAQIAAYITSIACWRGMLDLGLVDPGNVVASAGLSFGELTCLAISGSLSFRDGLPLVVRRGKAMQAALEAAHGGGLCVALTDEKDLQEVIAHCQEAAVLSVLCTKNTTSLLTGSVEALDRAARYVKDRFNVSAFRTADSVAFHSSLLSPAVPEFSEAMNAISFQEPSFSVISGSLVRPYDRSNIEHLLAYNIPNRLDWLGTCAYIREQPKCKDAMWLVLEPAGYVAGDLRRMKPPIKGVTNCDEPW